MYPVNTRLQSRILKLCIRNRVSEPFLSQAWFRKISDVVISELKTPSRQNQLSLQSAKVIYCYSHILEDFLSTFADSLENRVVISGSTDKEFMDPSRIHLGQLKKLYLQNSLVSDGRRIFTLPIGIEDYALGLNGLKNNMISGVPWDRKNDQILVGPFSATDPSRLWLMQKARNNPRFHIVDKMLTPRNYARLASQYKFIACPRGKGVDSHRMWESFYRNSIPIVTRNPWSESLLDLNVPVAIVDTWESLLESTSIVLERSPNCNPRELPQIWTPYWEGELLHA